jgi:hypothetical protein
MGSTTVRGTAAVTHPGRLRPRTKKASQRQSVPPMVPGVPVTRAQTGTDC